MWWVDSSQHIEGWCRVNMAQLSSWEIQHHRATRIFWPFLVLECTVCSSNLMPAGQLNFASASLKILAYASWLTHHNLWAIMINNISSYPRLTCFKLFHNSFFNPMGAFLIFHCHLKGEIYLCWNISKYCLSQAFCCPEANGSGLCHFQIWCEMNWSSTIM